MKRKRLKDHLYILCRTKYPTHHWCKNCTTNREIDKSLDSLTVLEPTKDTALISSSSQILLTTSCIGEVQLEPNNLTGMKVSRIKFANVFFLKRKKIIRSNNSTEYIRQCCPKIGSCHVSCVHYQHQQYMATENILLKIER